jgi:hypothetical protein
VTRKRRPGSAQPTVIDACCLIDLLASRQAETILRATGHAWHLPSSVQAEVKYVRKHDPNNPLSFRNVLVDLTPFVSSGLLTPCQANDPTELARYVQYASLFRSDGEALCLALAECRGWTVATDDRRAIQVAKKAGLSVVSCPELVKAWADANRPDVTSVGRVLNDIQTLAQFRPNPRMPEYRWWINELAKTSP